MGREWIGPRTCMDINQKTGQNPTMAMACWNLFVADILATMVATIRVVAMVMATMATAVTFQ